MKITMKTNRLAWLLALLISISAAPVCHAAQGDLIWDPKTKSWKQSAPQKTPTQKKLEKISKLIQNGDYEAAINQALLYRSMHPNSPGCEEAHFLEGQANMEKGEYWEAYHCFEKQIQTYPGGVFFERALDRELQIAKAFLKGRKRRALRFFKIDATEDGVEMLEKIAALSPGTEIGEKAQLGLGDHYFDTEQYKEAVAAYDFFVENNPNSQRKPYAMLQAARSSFLRYRGVNWEKSPLIDAAARYRVIAAAYPKLAKSERIEEILVNIRSELAHKLWNTAQFYERTKKRRAAIFYYKKLLADYPKTSWAKRAREILAEYNEITGVRQQPQKKPPREPETPKSDAPQTPPIKKNLPNKPEDRIVPDESEEDNPAEPGNRKRRPSLEDIL